MGSHAKLIILSEGRPSMRSILTVAVVAAASLLVGACAQDSPPPRRPWGGGYGQGPGQGGYWQGGGGRHSPLPYGAGVAVTATAPSWLNPTFLGAPLDANFQAFRGAGAAAPVFSGGPLPPTPIRAFESEYYKADKTLEIQANLSTWVVDAGVSSDATTRFMSQRARYVEYAVELNERSAMNRVPQGAAWYVGKIYYGSIYEEVLYEHDTTLTANVAAGFLSWGGDMKTYARNNRLQDAIVARGLAPKTGAALFSHSSADVQQNFTITGASVPIMVEYRSVPNTTPQDYAIPWR